MININLRDPKPLYEQVRAGFIRLITTGAIGPDEKLPSVRELANSLVINPNTIQKAYALLESEGYIYTVAGRGSFACAENSVSEKRKGELMDEVERAVRELRELNCDKREIKNLIDEVYKENNSKGGSVNAKN